MYIPPKVKPLCPPEQPPRFEDVVYAETTLDNGEAYTLRLDIYQDAHQTEPGPCIVYYFGGGWMWGEYKQKTQKAVYCRDLVRLTKQGYTIVCPDYRLVSQAVFPACIHDSKAVIRFLKAHAAQYHIDPQRIGVLGNSAGAHLAAMVAMSAGHPELEGTVGGNLDQSSSVRAACLFYTPADLEQSLREAAANLTGEPKDLTGTEIENVGNDKAGIVPALIVGYTGPGRTMQSLASVLERGDPTDPDWHFIELTRQCSPIHYASADNPPICLFHGGRDPIVPLSQSEALYKALLAAGADATFVSYSFGGHGPSLGEQVDQFAYRFLTDRL
ncbi:alpha/beta hydrolase [Ruthenibacterium sp. CLA-JM-H11]|uniref:Alpha/beta hydrolase n=1 Tax=Ruthenibacterium intestinale TaxID=3133163 RepID=A0ABV1GD20_9FIRM